MDFESIERCWRDGANALPPTLEKGAVMRMIEAQAAALRGSLRHRLRREVGYYVPMMALSAATLIAGFTISRLVAACAVIVLLGAMIATLRRAERRIEEAPRDISVRDALDRLISEVDRAGRAYLTAYVLVFAVTGAAVTGFVWWRQGAGLPLACATAASFVAVVWSRISGLGYVERMFRRYRAQLAGCLRQLDNGA